MKNLFTFITKLAIASAFVFFFSAAYASAATYYLAPTGSDSNSCTQTSPCFTLEKAWQIISAGDTVYMRGGTYAYNDMQYLQGKNGISGNLIKIWAYPGETPNITRSSTYKIVNGVDQDLIYFEGNYFHFKGLEISNFAQKSNETPYPAFRAGYTNYSTFENINYHHNMSAFQIRGNSTGNLILNSDFHHNKDPYGDAPYDGADGLGITFNYDPNSVNTIRGSRAYWNADDGFDTWENAGHVIIENSWSFYNGYLPDTFTAAGNGTAFKLGSIATPSTQTKRTLKNNIAYKNRFAGYVENNAGVKMEMYNNTSVNAGYSGYWFGAWSGNGNVTIAKNNLDYLGTNAPGPWNTASTVTNNSWQNNITVTNADFASMDDSQLLGARKSDNSLPDITFLRPVASSDLVNKGTPISGMSYSGSAPDIGALEYTGTSTTASTTFTVGQRVQVNATSLNVRGTASATGTLLGTQANGALGTISGGPTSADGYVWWNVNYDSGVDGWSAENFLTAYTATTTTTTTGAKTYYLSPTGNDNNACTLSLPCFTLQKVWTLIAPGDTVYLRGGTYTYTKQQGLTGKNGTSGNLIKIWAYPGEIPVITRSATGYTTDIYWHRSGIFFTGNYFHFKGLEITGYKNINGNIENALLGYDASNNIFEQLNIHHNHHGLYLENNSSNNLILNSDFHDNYDTQGSGGNSDGVGLSYNTGTNNVVDGCRAWNNGDDGFDTFEHKGLVTIKNSWAWHNGYVYGTSTPAGNGVGFKLGSNFLQGTSLQNTVVRVVQNTISADNRDSGYHINEGDHRAQLYNNVSYGNEVAGLNFHWNNLVHTFKNNVSFGNGNTQVEVSSNSVSSNNSYGTGGHSDGGSGWQPTASTADFVSLDLNQLDNPRKSDGSLPDITAFHLASTSDLINAGTPISGISYSGSAPDIGAFEYTGTVTTTDTTAPTATITTPTASSTVSGTASTVSATATDNVAVSKVEFYRGTALMSSDAATPYSATWDTTTVANGSYTLSAKAYDTSGNVGTSSSVAVVVSNNTPDTTAPTVPTNLAGTAASSSQINLTWTASTDAVGVTGYKIYRNGTQIATSTTNSYNNTGLTAGTAYSYTVAAYDAAGNTSSQSTAKSVTTSIAANAVPMANAGSDQTITLPTSSVTLSGSGTDSDGTIASYAWTKVSGGSATIASPSSASTSVTGLSQGTYTFWLTVTDNKGATNADSVTVVVNPAQVANVSPTANAGSDKTITLPTSSVTLSGSGTDSDGTIASYLWTKISGTGGTITNSTSASTTFTGLTEGSYTLRLTVADNLGATGYDDVTVTVNPGAGGGVGTNGFSDDFNRADSTTFGSSWIKRVSGTADFKLISNKVELTGNYLETASLHTTSGITSPNYTVQSKIKFPSTDSMFAGVAGRRVNKTGANYNGYMAFAEPGEQSVTLYKRVGTTWTRLGTYATTINPGTEYTIGLSMNGTTIKALWNGAEVLSVTDSKFTATGSAAIVIGTGYEVVGVTWDDFSVTPN